MMTAVSSLRAQVEAVDDRLISLIAERLRLARAIGAMKRAAGQPVTDPAREAAVVARAAGLARDADIPEEEIRALYWRLLAMSRRVQLESGSADRAHRTLGDHGPSDGAAIAAEPDAAGGLVEYHVSHGVRRGGAEVGA
jgi:chorismate mutase